MGVELGAIGSILEINSKQVNDHDSSTRLLLNTFPNKEFVTI
jgi:hypothetical protein